MTILFDILGTSCQPAACRLFLNTPWLTAGCRQRQRLDDCRGCDTACAAQTRTEGQGTADKVKAKLAKESGYILDNEGGG